jgi:hypothetical protein
MASDIMANISRAFLIWVPVVEYFFGHHYHSLSARDFDLGYRMGQSLEHPVFFCWKVTWVPVRRFLPKDSSAD